MRVVHLIGSTGLYGAERWVLALMRALDTRSVQATLINLVDEQGGASEIVAAAQRRGLDAFDFFTGGKFQPYSAARLAEWMRGEHVSIIHGHGFKSDVVGILAGKLAGCKVMTTPHGWSLDDNLKLMMYEKLDRNIFRFMDMVCPLSPDLAKGIERYADSSKIRLIANGVDIDEVQSMPSAVRQEKDCFLLGYIGRLVEGKDVATLLNSIKAVADCRGKIRLMVIGEGPEQGALMAQAVRLGIDAITEFAGFKPDATAYLKICDAFILPSLSEGTPRCVMEAMAAGIPVVASDIPGNRNLVIDQETGLLFAPGDSLALAEKIGALMLHPEEAQAMANRARKKVEAEFSNRKMAEEYTSIYYELYARKPP